MSSSESDVDLDGKKGIDRALFVRLLSEYPVVLEKSRVPKVVSDKKHAMEMICNNYSRSTGVVINTSQMNKMLQNIKTAIKKKTDVKATGNKKIKLHEWEKDFLSLLGAEGNPVFNKVPGCISVGAGCSSTLNQSEEITVTNSNSPQSGDINTSSTSVAAKRGINKLQSFETEVTKDLSTTQLQRLVLLQQYELQKVQLEKEKEIQAMNKVILQDKEVQTDDVIILDM